MVSKQVITLAVTLVALASLILLVGNFLGITGNVLIDVKGDFEQNDTLEGNLVLDIEEGDSLSEDLSMLLMVSKNDSVLSAETFSLKSYLELTEQEILPVTKPDGKYYEQVGTYKNNIKDMIDFTFEEPGKYELLFAIPSLDITERKVFLIE